MSPRFSGFTKILFAAAMLLPVAGQAKQKESVFYSFGITGIDSELPQDGVIADKAGNMYGTAYEGGDLNAGTAFIVGTNGLETPIYSFIGGDTDGAYPIAGLVMDKKGNLYGTTSMGGPANRGVVFELTPNGNSYTEKVLYIFCSQASCVDGANPAGRVVLGKKGGLYGTTQLGGTGYDGSHINGVLWRLDPPKKQETAWKQTVLYNFCSQTNCADGRGPYSSPLLAKDGFLYGTAAFNQFGGTLYRINTNGGSFQVLHTFHIDSADGATPISSLTADSDGVLYGTTRQGGGSGDCGTAYSFDPISFTYNLLHTFCSDANDGKTSYAGVTVVETKKAKTLYGNTLGGGENGQGTIFSLAAPKNEGDPWAEQVLYSFCAQANCTDGAQPVMGAPLNIGGVFYGVTQGGGAFNGGALFRYGKN